MYCICPREARDPPSRSPHDVTSLHDDVRFRLVDSTESYYITAAKDCLYCTFHLIYNIADADIYSFQSTCIPFLTPAADHRFHSHLLRTVICRCMDGYWYFDCTMPSLLMASHYSQAVLMPDSTHRHHCGCRTAIRSLWCWSLLAFRHSLLVHLHL